MGSAEPEAGFVGIPPASRFAENGTEEIRERISSACLGFPGGGNPDSKCSAGAAFIRP